MKQVQEHCPLSLSSNNVKEWCGDQGLHSTDGTMDVQGGINAKFKTAFQGPGWRPSERTCHLPSLVHGWGNLPRPSKVKGMLNITRQVRLEPGCSAVSGGSS